MAHPRGAIMLDLCLNSVDCKFQNERWNELNVSDYNELLWCLSIISNPDVYLIFCV